MNLPRLSCCVKSISWNKNMVSLGSTVSITAIVSLKAAKNKDAPRTKVEKEFEKDMHIFPVKTQGIL